mmetsp:Transcript_13468/g.13517  ORF Transcript_13468/g.13517 Transcript_13468/m.13517 type:complete len:189 (-) Transcript_13468:20-586(-)
MERYTANLALSHPWITRSGGKIPLTHLETMRGYSDRLNLKTISAMTLILSQLCLNSGRKITKKYMKIINHTSDKDYEAEELENSIQKCHTIHTIPDVKIHKRASSKQFSTTTSFLSVPTKISRPQSGSPANRKAADLTPPTTHELLRNRLTRLSPRPQVEHFSDIRKTKSPIPRSPKEIAPFRDTKLS